MYKVIFESVNNIHYKNKNIWFFYQIRRWSHVRHN